MTSENLVNATLLAEEIAGDFYEGMLDLTARDATMTTGWSTMPRSRSRSSFDVTGRLNDQSGSS